MFVFGFRFRWSWSVGSFCTLQNPKLSLQDAQSYQASAFHRTYSHPLARKTCENFCVDRNKGLAIRLTVNVIMRLIATQAVNAAKP